MSSLKSAASDLDRWVPLGDAHSVSSTRTRPESGSGELLLSEMRDSTLKGRSEPLLLHLFRDARFRLSCPTPPAASSCADGRWWAAEGGDPCAQFITHNCGAIQPILLQLLPLIVCVCSPGIEQERWSQIPPMLRSCVISFKFYARACLRSSGVPWGLFSSFRLPTRPQMFPRDSAVESSDRSALKWQQFGFPVFLTDVKLSSAADHWR